MGFGADLAEGERFAAAAGCPQAAAAAIDCLESGGNVVDAAIAACAVTCVAMPQATTIGGDLFALVRRAGRVFAVNASGAAPRRATIDAFRARGCVRVPDSGASSVEAPGLVAGWEALHARWGSRPLAALLAPAIALARDGVAVSPRLAAAIRSEQSRCAGEPGWSELLAPGGIPLAAGARLVQPALARTLARIAEHGARGFYEGPVARDIAATLLRASGFLDEDDLAGVAAEVAVPLAIRFRGRDVLSQPPVSHGAVLLRALALLDAAAPDASEIWTRAADALATAFGERLALLGDGARAAAEAMIAGRAPAVAGVPAFAAHGTETTTLSVADRDCNAVAMIQSVFADFGSGVVAPESGVILNNRLCGFFLDPAHPNSLASGRRTMHTLHSWMAVGPAGDLLAGGSPGGDHQPQVNLQLLARLLALGESPRAAAAAPRFALWPMTVPHELARGPRRLLIEDDFGEDAAFAGRAVERAGSGLGSVKFVGAASGAVFACADRRREGAALAR